MFVSHVAIPTAVYRQAEGRKSQRLASCSEGLHASGPYRCTVYALNITFTESNIVTTTIYHGDDRFDGLVKQQYNLIIEL